MGEAESSGLCPNMKFMEITLKAIWSTVGFEARETNVLWQ